MSGLGGKGGMVGSKGSGVQRTGMDIGSIEGKKKKKKKALLVGSRSAQRFGRDSSSTLTSPTLLPNLTGYSYTDNPFSLVCFRVHPSLIF